MVMVVVSPRDTRDIAGRRNVLASVASGEEGGVGIGCMSKHSNMDLSYAYSGL